MQTSLSDIEYGNRKKKTRREVFLQTMDRVVPWTEIIAQIEPFYFHNRTGRPPVGIEMMLRMYFLQIWFSLSDDQTEDEILDSRAMRDFMGINFLERQAPDATTLLKFRHLLEKHGMQEIIEKMIVEILDQNGLIMHGGTVTDASIFDAPSSTRNSTKSRDPEMKSCKKGKNYRFGMKAHTGVDVGSGAVVSSTYTAANEHDITQAAKNYREDDTDRYGDSGFLGVQKREEVQLLDDGKIVNYHICKRPSQRKEKHNYAINWEKKIEAQKAARRWIVEYPYYIVKHVFGYKKAAYRGIEKNANRLRMSFASANLYMFRHRLLAISP